MVVPQAVMDAETELPDPWLQRWISKLVQQAQGRPVLEMGCGLGEDTETLTSAGLNVHAFDLSARAVEQTRRRVPSAQVERRDIRDPFPASGRDVNGDEGYGAVLASLTLHYFPWDQTVEVVKRIHTALAPGGMLLCRLNSTEDRHFGANGHPTLEENYYLVEGLPKRFFDEKAVDLLFADKWQVLSKQHLLTSKYVQSKAHWEVILLRQ